MTFGLRLARKLGFGPGTSLETRWSIYKELPGKRAWAQNNPWLHDITVLSSVIIQSSYRCGPGPATPCSRSVPGTQLCSLNSHGTRRMMASQLTPLSFKSNSATCCWLCDLGQYSLSLQFFLCSSLPLPWYFPNPQSCRGLFLLHCLGSFLHSRYNHCNNHSYHHGEPTTHQALYPALGMRHS